MNVDTGELRRILKGESIPDGFEQLNEVEEVEAERLLGDKNSVMLPEDHPLRKAVQLRQQNNAVAKRQKQKKAAKKARKRNR